MQTHLTARTRPLAALVVLTMLAAASVLASPVQRAAAVDEAKPAGPGCAGIAFKDPRGDQTDDYSGQGAGEEGAGPANLDIIEGWFSTSAKGTTANIRIADLNTAVPGESSGGIYWYMVFDIGDTTHFVKAWVTKAGQVNYAGGYMDDSSVAFIVYNTDKETTGKLFEGPDGIVQIDIPPEVAPPGTVLTNTHADADYLQGQDDFFGLNAHADQAPDSGEGGKKFAVGGCLDGPAAPAGGGGGGGDTPGPGTGDAPGGDDRSTDPLPVTAPATLGKARKAKKGRRLRLKLTSTERVTDLVAIVKPRKGGRTLASGRLAELDGTRRVKLKLRRSLKRGTYALVVQGVVDGATRSYARRVKVK